ncbi:MAG: hypothetical protein ACE5GE_08660 [Phycisphaerae bacterium]
MNGYTPVINKQRSFLSTLAWGVSMVVISGVVAATLTAGYALNIVDRKTDNAVDLVAAVIDGVPELIESLPPFLADALSDRRMPEYASDIQVQAKLAPSGHHPGLWQPVVELTNGGPDVVSLLSMRVVVLNPSDEPVAEFTEWGATPLAADDHDWRGPLLPGATRHLRVHNHRAIDAGTAPDAYRVEVEFTDVRLWERPANRQMALADSAD